MHALTLLAFALHIGGGAIGLVAGTVAVIARKGGRLHRKAGTVFVFHAGAYASARPSRFCRFSWRWD